MPTVWLRHRALQARYSCSRNTIDRLCDEQQRPPKSFPCDGRAPMWSESLLDCWDHANTLERQHILKTWPNWPAALAAIEHARTFRVAEEP